MIIFYKEIKYTIVNKINYENINCLIADRYNCRDIKL